MDCPNCGTYNPEDRDTCWRCDKPLPKPRQEKRRNPQQSARRWLYVIVAIFLLYTLLQTCGVRLPFGPQLPESEGGLVPPAAVTWQAGGAAIG